MEEGTYTPEYGNNLVPVLDQYDNITDYRYMMTKDTKRTLLNQDITAAEVIGRTLGSIDDKVVTKAHNDKILKFILADMKANYDEDTSVGKLNKQEYIEIKKDSNNPKVQEIYKILPSNMKQAILDSDRGYIAVRRDMLHSYFGFRDATLTDFFGLYNITPEVIKRWIKYAEAIWKDIISISKVDIIIRTPIVFIGNIISNFMYSVVMGTNPLAVGKIQLESMRNLTAYMDKAKELKEAKIEEISGKNVKSKIARLEKELKDNPVHELMEAGMYTAIIEDVNKRDLKSTNRLAQRAKEFDLVRSAPQFIKTGVNWLYLNENTPYFQKITKFTQYSDFIARATEFKILQAKGVKKEEAINTVLDTFINYTKPASSFEEYLNDMGFIMFTKYAKRIQRVIMKSGKEKPMNILLSVLGQEAFFEVDDIWDQHPLVRSYTNIGINPIEHIERFLTPSALEVVAAVID